MHRILTIAKREFTAMIATKAFLVTLIMMPILMGGGIIVMPMISKIEGGKERKIAIIDHGGQLADAILKAADVRNEFVEAQTSVDTEDALGGNLDTYKIESVDPTNFGDEERLAYSKKITDGDLYAFVELPTELTAGIDPKNEVSAESVKIRFVSTSGTLSDLRGWLRNIIRTELRTRGLVARGVDPTAVASAEPNMQMMPSRPYKADEEGKPIIKDDDDTLATIFAPIALMGLMFLVIFLAAQPMLESAMEEKTQKISEVMLGNVSPREMLTGKLMGNVAGSMIVFAIYGVGGYFLLWQMEMTDLVPASLWGWFVIFQLLGVLLFSSIFMVIGASVNQLKEAQSLLIPVWMVLMIPMMIWFVVVKDPNGIIATVLTLFPPSTPMMSILRLGTGAAIPSWQLPVAAVLLLITTSVIVTLAARIYRASLLRSDSATTLMQLIKRAA